MCDAFSDNLRLYRWIVISPSTSTRQEELQQSAFDGGEEV